MKTIEFDPKKAIAEFEGLLDEHLKDRKDIIYNMFFEKEMFKRFYAAPASTSLDFHCAFDGGLVVHTLSVVKILLELNEILEIRASAGTESIVIAGAFHDLGKIGDGTGQLYLPEQEAWWREKRGRMYQTNDTIQSMPHSLRSIFILQEAGIPLNVDEFFAIQYHDGMYLQQGQDVQHKETSLCKALHFADLWSSHELEQRLDPKNTANHRRPW